MKPTHQRINASIQLCNYPTLYSFSTTIASSVSSNPLPQAYHIYPANNPDLEDTSDGSGTT
jgi:hypothetical protein